MKMTTRYIVDVEHEMGVQPILMADGGIVKGVWFDPSDDG